MLSLGALKGEVQVTMSVCLCPAMGWDFSCRLIKLIMTLETVVYYTVLQMRILRYRVIN